MNKIIKVLATPHYFSSKEFKIKKNPSKFKFKVVKGPINNKNKLIKLLSNVEAFIIGSEKIDEEILNKSKNLKIIVRFGTSVTNIDLKACKKKNITVKKLNKNINSISVARHTLAILMSITNNISIFQTEKKNFSWKRKINLSPQNYKLGIIGMGRIGKIFSSYANRLGFKINYFSRTKQNVPSNYKYFKDIKELIKNSEIISIHLGLNKNTRKLFNYKILNLFKNKYLINTSRGGILDEKYLYQLLKKKQIICAGLDVFENEPPINNSLKIIKLNNVISTPHNAAYDEVTLNKMFDNSFLYLKNYFKNKKQI